MFLHRNLHALSADCRLFLKNKKVESMKQNLIIAAKLLAIFVAIVGTFWLVNPPRQGPIVTNIESQAPSK